MGKVKKNEVRIPDIEIIVRAASSDVCVVALYAGDTPHDEWEVLAGISDHDDVVHIRAALQTAIRSLDATYWLSLDELDSRALEDKDAPPF